MKLLMCAIPFFAVLVFTVALEGQGSGPVHIAEYQYTVQDGGLEFKGYLIKTGPDEWIERTDKPGTVTFFFKEIPGEKGWITLYDNNRKLYARLRPNQYGPLETAAEPMGTWNALPWPLTPIIVEPSPSPSPSPTATPRPEPATSDKKVATAFGIAGVIVMLILAIFFPRPTAFQYTVFRIILALAGAGVGATIPGLLDVNVSGAIRASGAIGVFVIVYFFSPARLVTDVPPP